MMDVGYLSTRLPPLLPGVIPVASVYMGTYLQVEIINEDWLAARVHSAPLLYKLNLYSTEYQGEEQVPLNF